MNVLDVPLPDRPEDCGTVKEYLKHLLSELWRRRDDFSGKRPFGDSGWEYSIYGGLIAAGMVEEELDPDHGYIDFFPSEERDKADRLIAEGIESL